MSNNLATIVMDHPEIPSLAAGGVNWIFTADIGSIIDKSRAAINELLSVESMYDGEPSFCCFRRDDVVERVSVSKFRSNSAFRDVQWQLLSSPYNRFVHSRNESMWWVKGTSTVYRSQETWHDLENQIKFHERPRKHEWEHVIPIKRTAKDLLAIKRERPLRREDAVRILFHPLALVTKEEHDRMGCTHRHTHPERRNVTDLGFLPFLRYSHVLPAMQVISVVDGSRIDLDSHTLEEHFEAIRSLLPIGEIWQAVITE